MIKRSIGVVSAILLTAACGGAATAPASASASRIPATASPTPLTAKAEVKDKDGVTVATATFSETAAGSGVSIALSVTKLPAGQHGWHLHTTGMCTPPDFASAGGHFNPDGRQHGAQNPQGPHAGDLGNVTVAADGTAKLSFVAKAVTLETGKPTSLFKDGGTALVIHANPDDEKTDPSGNSGGRVACGVIQK